MQSVHDMYDVVDVFVDGAAAVDVAVSVALEVLVVVLVAVEDVVDAAVFAVAFGDGPKMNNISFDLQ